MKNNTHSVRRLGLAYKNAQRKFSKGEEKYKYFEYFLREEIKAFGFDALNPYCFIVFLQYLSKIKPRRRQTIMRIGRAAAKNNTTIWVHHFKDSVKDLRTLPFKEKEMEYLAIQDFKRAKKKVGQFLTIKEIVDLVWTFD